MSFRDLEQGRESPQPVTQLEAHASNAESPEFMHLTDQVGLHIFRVNANVATLQKLDTQLRGANNARGDALIKQFNDLSEQTRGIFKDATDDVKALSLFPLQSASSYATRSSPALLMQSKLQRDFQQALASFQAIQRAGIRSEKEALAAAKAQSAEASEVAEAPAQLSEQVYAPTVSHAEIEQQHALIAEREAEIRDIETGVQELNEIFRDLSHIVQEQGGMIDNIEYNMGNLASNVHGADRELIQAHSYQRRAGRRALCLIIIAGFVVAVVLLALLS